MTDTTNIDPFAQTQSETENYLEVLVGEGKKFKTVDDLARGKYEADKHISNLEKELNELRTKAEQGLSLKDFYEKIRGETSNNGNSGQPNVDQNKEPTASPEDIEKIVRDALEKSETERAVKTNAEQVRAKLAEVWGENASKELSRISNEIGVPIEELRNIGVRSPKALYKMLGIDGSAGAPSGTVAPTGRVVTPNDASGVRNQSYYNKLYRENPKLRHDSKIAAQEMRDAVKLGPAFFT